MNESDTEISVRSGFRSICLSERLLFRIGGGWMCVALNWKTISKSISFSIATKRQFCINRKCSIFRVGIAFFPHFTCKQTNIEQITQFDTSCFVLCYFLIIKSVSAAAAALCLVYEISLQCACLRFPLHGVRIIKGGGKCLKYR